MPEPANHGRRQCCTHPSTPATPFPRGIKASHTSFWGGFCGHHPLPHGRACRRRTAKHGRRPCRPAHLPRRRHRATRPARPSWCSSPSCGRRSPSLRRGQRRARSGRRLSSRSMLLAERVTLRKTLVASWWMSASAGLSPTLRPPPRAVCRSAGHPRETRRRCRQRSCWRWPTGARSRRPSRRRPPRFPRRGCPSRQSQRSPRRGRLPGRARRCS